MALAAGTRLGPYEIVAPLGAGGMGEVYRARDTRLDRTVAVKVLAPAFGADPERRSRFEREARTISGLNHPHICTLYDVGREAGVDFLVMEHLEGQTLAERLTRGPLSLDQALLVGAQIADALSVAHRQGIIHRDLKPGNVMFTMGGGGRSTAAHVKLLDFGLAKLTGHGERSALSGVESLPTRSEPLTGRGTILGTLQYMAPEQLEGREADARTDLWALGAILYEMVTGRRAFVGTSQASLVGQIMNATPPALATLQPLTPPAFDRLVQQCLAKQPDDRWDTAHDVGDELRWLAATLRDSRTGAATPRRRASAIAAVAALGLLAGAGIDRLWTLRSIPLPVTVVRSEIGVAPAERLDAGLPGSAAEARTRGGSRTALALSPDGSLLVFVGQQGGIRRLFLRPLRDAEATPLAGTDGAQTPVFSPDGQWVAFWASGDLKKLRLAGGPVTPVCKSLGAAGLTWGPKNELIFAETVRGGLSRVSGDGGAPKPLTVLQPDEISHRLPHVLPGGKWVMFTVRRTIWVWGTEEIDVVSLATGERRTLLKNAVDAQYVAPGYLVYLQLGTLYARPFDPETLAFNGSAVALVSDAAQAVWELGEPYVTGSGQFAVASAGTLAYISGGMSSPPQARLVALDRRGAVTIASQQQAPFAYRPAVIRDGQTVAVSSVDPRESTLWMLDLARDTKARLTTDGEVAWPCWTPDGRRIAFQWRRAGRVGVAVSQPGSEQSPEWLTTAPNINLIAPSSWSPDGKALAVSIRQPDWTYDIGLVAVGDQTPKPLIQSKFTEFGPEFSRDGRWVAYTSNESGRFEVYVRPYPDPGARLQVSTRGGSNPAWSPNGRELFYVGLPDERGTASFMAVGVDAHAAAPFGLPHRLFDVPADVRMASSPGRNYDVLNDGTSFLALQTLPRPAPPPVTHVHLVQNWPEELKAKVPVQ